MGHFLLLLLLLLPFAASGSVARAPEKLFASAERREGGGYIVRRPVGGSDLPELDPFIRIDHRALVRCEDFHREDCQTLALCLSSCLSVPARCPPGHLCPPPLTFWPDADSTPTFSL